MFEILSETGGALYVRALKKLPPDVQSALRQAAQAETNGLAREILQTIVRNVEVARDTDNIICQDTGTPIYFVRVPE